MDDFKQPILVEDYKLYLTVSIGVAIYPEAGIDSISLIKNAEVALYKAKDMEAIIILSTMKKWENRNI